MFFVLAYSGSLSDYLDKYVRTNYLTHRRLTHKSIRQTLNLITFELRVTCGRTLTSEYSNLLVENCLRLLQEER